MATKKLSQTASTVDLGKQVVLITEMHRLDAIHQVSSRVRSYHSHTQ